MKKHWPIKTLEEITDLHGGSTPSRDNPVFWGGDIYWVTPTDLPSLDEGISIVTRTKEKITQAGLENSSATIVPEGTVLFSSRATIGKVAVADMPLTTNQGFANFVPQPDIISRFLAYSLWYRREDIARLSGSTTFKEVSRSTLRKYKIPVPPLDEQERIVKILDEADELRKLRAQADRRTADLIPALFHEMFGDISCPKKNSSVFTIRDLLENKSIIDVQDGNHGEIHPKASEYTTVGIPFIFAKHISKNRFDISACPFLTRERSRKLRIGFSKPNDVLLSHKGSIGFTAIVPSDFEFIILSPQVTYYRFDTQKINPFFAWGYFQTSSFQNLLECLSQQATRAYIGITRQKELPFLVPPLSLQQEFAQRVAEIREMEADQAKSKSRLDALFHSLLHRAFEGEL